MPISRSPSPDSRFALMGRSFGNIFSHTGSETNDNIVNPTTPPRTGMLQSLFQDLSSQGSRLGADVSLLASLIDIEINGGLVNDRKYLMERVIQLAASLPEDSGKLKDLTGKLIKNLWENLHHPPLSYLGEEYRYRRADGSHNNIMYRSLGMAGNSYARTVTPMTLVPGARPDAGTIFDALFARGHEAREHPSKISSTMFHFASIIIHDIFRTDDCDPNKLKNSSYLDMSPLYGSSEKEVNDVRSHKGDGTLKPDAFAETRLLAFPPGVATLLVCFNRFHNYVAQQLAVINEGDRFTIAEEAKENPEDKRFQKRDNDLFQTARLITCGLYVNIILNDYVRTILNLNRTNSDWTLDPRKSFDEIFASDGTPSGVGNAVSVEFNLIYRWHSTMSVADDEWTQKFYKLLFPDTKDHSTLQLPEFHRAMKKWVQDLPTDPGKRTFYDGDMNELKRDDAGAFDDEKLVEILTKSTEDVSGAFGARNVPVVMKLVEVLGIEQARKWQVATLNEFRKFFKLEPYTKFSEINSDKGVQESLKTLYGHPDYVELYPGVVAEEHKVPMKPGSGLCPGFTLSRTILADAVALTRGDRFYTVDNSPANLTNWGFQQASSNRQIANGHVIYKLIMRAFPKYYRASSVYAMFPFVVPDENRNILRDLKREEKFEYEEPSKVEDPVEISTWHGVTSVLGNKKTYKVPWGEHTTYLTGHDYMLSYDTDNEVTQRNFVDKSLYCPRHALQEVRDFYEFTTMELIKAQMHKLTPKVFQLDAVRDVGNPSHAIFMAKMFHIPLKTPESWIPDVTVSQLYDILGALFAYVFLDGDVASSMFLRDAAKDAVEKLGKLVGIVCRAVKAKNILMPLDLGEIFGRRRQGQTAHGLLDNYGIKMIERLFEGGKSVDEVVWTIIPTAAAGVVTQSQGFAQMLDLYLSDEYKHHWERIADLSLSDARDQNAFEELKRYGLEAFRLAPSAFGLVRSAACDATIHDGKKGTIKVSEGQQIYTNFVTAGRDPDKFPHPEEIILDRPIDDYIHHGWGPHSCLGREMVRVAAAAQLRVFGRLKNLRRAPGHQGKLKFQHPPNVPSGIKAYMKEDWSDWYPFPTTMKVHFDELLDPDLTQVNNFLTVSVDPRAVPPSPADSGIGWAATPTPGLQTPGLKRTFENEETDLNLSDDGSEESSRGKRPRWR